MAPKDISTIRTLCSSSWFAGLYPSMELFCVLTKFTFLLPWLWDIYMNEYWFLNLFSWFRDCMPFLLVKMIHGKLGWMPIHLVFQMLLISVVMELNWGVDMHHLYHQNQHRYLSCCSCVRELSYLLDLRKLHLGLFGSYYTRKCWTSALLDLYALRMLVISDFACCHVEV